MNPIEALDFAVAVSGHRANKLRVTGKVGRAVLDRIRRHEEAADALQALRDQVAAAADEGESGHDRAAYREVGRGAREG